MMKSLVCSAIVIGALLAGPGLAQTEPVPVGPSVEAAPQAADLTVAPLAHDPEIEVAFWESVKDSDDPMLYLAYLEQFPEGAFRVIARDRLDELWNRATRAFALLEELGVSLDTVPGTVGVAPVVVNPPVVAKPPKPAPEVPTWEMTRNVQNQLRRHGCYKGAVDGVWGDGSQAAMRRFNRRANTSFLVYQPTKKALSHLRSLSRAGVKICR